MAQFRVDSQFSVYPHADAASQFLNTQDVIALVGDRSGILRQEHLPGRMSGKFDNSHLALRIRTDDAERALAEQGDAVRSLYGPVGPISCTVLSQNVAILGIAPR
jgi:hypothetical protein